MSELDVFVPAVKRTGSPAIERPIGIIVLTETEYDELESVDENTLYFVVADET